MAIILKKTKDNKCWQECGEKEILLHGDKNANSCTVIMENSMAVPKT
jgi:hypothetical protein